MTQKSGNFSSLIVMTLCAVIQVIAQVVFQMVIAQRFGAGASIDAFSTSLAMPTAINAILAGSIGYVIMPLLVPLARDGASEAYRQLACSLGIWSVSIALAVSASVFLLAPSVVAVLFSAFDIEQKQLTINLLRILAPLIVLGTLQGWLQAIENSQSRFIRPALASVVGPSTATLLILLPGTESQGVAWLGWALVIGAAMAVITLLPTIKDAIPERWESNTSATLGIFKKILPLVGINSYTKLDPIIDRVLLAGLTVGSIAHLNYAQRFVTALVLVVSSGISTLAFSDLAGAAQEGGQVFRDRVADNLRKMLIFVLPVVVGLIFFSEPTIRELLERGKFNTENTQEVAGILMALSGFFAAATLGDLIAKAFYSLGDTRTPSWIGAVAFTLGIGLKLVGVSFDGVRGLAFGSSAYYLVSAIAMAYALSRRCESFRWRSEILPTVLRVLLATSLGGLGAYCVLATSWPHIWWLAVIIGAVIYGISLWLLGDQTWRGLLGDKAKSIRGGTR